MLSHIKNLLLRCVSQVFEPQIATNLASKTSGLFTKDPQNRPLTHRLTTFAKKHHNFKWRRPFIVSSSIYCIASSNIAYMCAGARAGAGEQLQERRRGEIRVCH